MSKTPAPLLTLALLAVGSARPVEARAQGNCAPTWLPTFGGEPGVSDRIQALAVFDDGGGKALYAGGSFTTAGGFPASRVARWDGTSWSPLGLGLDGAVHALAVFDDGSGAKLYAGGSFTSAGGAPASHVACWDGASWSALGLGVDDDVQALAVFDDGGGARLCAGGTFTSAGGTAANRIALWDGASWSPLGLGLSDSVRALAVCDVGGGLELYAAGDFILAGGGGATRIARWDGASWAPLGSGLNGEVRALASFDDGHGAGLYAGGRFLSAGGVAANRVARWDGASWTPLGTGMNDQVHVLSVCNDGGGPRLFAGGSFTTAGGADAQRIARWNGASWAPLAGGLGPLFFSITVESLAVFDEGAGPALFAGGSFGSIDVTPTEKANVMNIARWDGAKWSALGDGLDYAVSTLVPFDDGSGPALYTIRAVRNGSFVEPGRQVARWNGASWESLGAPFGPGVDTLAVHDDGGGPELYAGGDFDGLVARWDGASWRRVGFGLGAIGNVRSLVSFDYGSGPVLVAAGNLYSYSSNIAFWNGSAWSFSACPPAGCADRLAVHDDGGGPALIAAGPQGGVSRWTHPGWTPLGLGMNDGVYSLASFDDGSGPALYAGGAFTSADGAPASHIARWDGAGWSEVGGGLGGSVFALAVYDDGSGPALYAGGFPSAGLARWDGVSWSPLPSVGGSVFALTVFDDHGIGGPWLAVGGDFVTSPRGDSFLAHWHRCPDTLPPTIACPAPVLVLESLTGPPGELASFTVTASDGHDPAPDVVCFPPSGSFFPRGTTMVHCVATDASGNTASCEFPVTVSLKARRR